MEPGSIPAGGHPQRDLVPIAAGGFGRPVRLLHRAVPHYRQRTGELRPPCGHEQLRRVRGENDFPAHGPGLQHSQEVSPADQEQSDRRQRVKTRDRLDSVQFAEEEALNPERLRMWHTAKVELRHDLKYLSHQSHPIGIPALKGLNLQRAQSSSELRE